MLLRMPFILEFSKLTKSGRLLRLLLQYAVSTGRPLRNKMIQINV